jgi:hypothetical protein
MTNTNKFVTADGRYDYGKIRAHADRTAKMIITCARETSSQAGLDPQLLGIHPHNAMCAFEAGQPWPEVNYSLCRKVLWLIEKSYEPTRLLSRMYDRLGHKAFYFGY